MKKLTAMVLALVILLSTAVAAGIAYMGWALDTMGYIGEFKDRLVALREIDKPTEMDVELTLRYADIYSRLMSLFSLETKAQSTTVVPSDASDPEAMTEVLLMIRQYYDAKLLTGKDVIQTVVDGLLGD